MTNILTPNVPPVGVTSLGTRSENTVESYSLFDLTFPVFPSVIPVSSFHGREKARQALALRYIWLVALHTTESRCGLYFMKNFL